MSKKLEPIDDAQDPQEAETPLHMNVVERVPSTAAGISALASANAPFVFFDDVPFLGHVSGVGQITLTTRRLMASAPDGKAATDHVVTAHLRASLPALRNLRAAIDKAEAMILKANAALPPAPPGGMAH